MVFQVRRVDRVRGAELRGDLVDALYLFSKLRESAACLLLDAVLVVRQLGADLVRDDHGEVILILRSG
jgi:hypothetical protein